MKRYFNWVVLFLLFFQVVHSQSVVINEVLTSNTTVNTDEDGSFEDWVELYNASDVTVNLENYGISDNPSDPFKWVFPNVSIAPGGHLLIWCSDKNRTYPQLPLHTNFKISADGETITLTMPSGVVADQCPPQVIPQNQSYGRSPSGAETFVIFDVPSPGSLNQGGAPLPLTSPEFSIPSGSSAESFALTLSHPDPEVTILYTLDGSEPNAANLGGKTYQYKNQYRESPGDPDGDLMTQSFETLTYLSPIVISDRSLEPNDISGISTTIHQNPYYIPAFPVTKSTVVRARAIKGGNTSSTITQTYFVGDASFSLPVISISVDEDVFFGYENGIHVAGQLFDEWRNENPDGDSMYGNTNYSQSGSSWQTRANLSYFEENSEILNQDIDIRINGGFSRIYPNKSLRLYARSQYGNSEIQHPFFGSDYPFDSFERLVLRNSGNDAHHTFFRDGFIQRSVSHLHMSYQPSRPVVTFINGEYWGILNIRERYDDKYFERVYGIDGDDLDFLEYDGSLIQEGENTHYLAMMDFVANNSLADSGNYDYLKTQMDTENFADFFLTNIFIRNTDWPHNNIEFFRKRTDYDPAAPYGQDGRWRWVLKDTDHGFGYSSGDAYLHNTLEFATATGGDPVLNPEWSTLLFRKLLENNDFRNYFVNRFADMLNTTFLPERLMTIIEQMKNDISGEISRHGMRWSVFTQESWESNVEVMNVFAQERPFYQRQHIQQKFSLANQIEAVIDVNQQDAGFVAINTIELRPSTPGVSENPYPWSGIYFSGVPVTVRAVPHPGFVFSHWTGASNSVSAEITVPTEIAFSLTAHFIPSTEPLETAISFWMADTSLANDTPFESLASSFELGTEGILEYESALPGYPYNTEHPLWRKASLERVNSPTDLNYLPEANNDIPFGQSNMRGLQVRQPFASESGENTLIFHQPTTGYQNIVLRFAAKDEGAASGISIDYSVDGENWTTLGLSAPNLALTNSYELYQIDFSEISLSDNNPDFAVRMRFTGDDMTADVGGRVIFNNISFSGTEFLSAPDTPSNPIRLFPNPASNVLNVAGWIGEFNYAIFSLDGRKVTNGTASSRIPLGDFSSGIYIVKIENRNRSLVSKFIKK